MAVLAAQTFMELARARLASLCDAAGFDPKKRERALAVLGDLIGPWAGNPIGPRPRTRSDITDDHFPIEFSLALNGDFPEVRVLFEAQAGQGSVGGQDALWNAGQAVNRKIEESYGASLSRLRRVEDLFLPDDDARYAMWHAVCFTREEKPAFKIYLNPQARGRSAAPALVAETLLRLGFSQAAAAQATRERRGEELKFFSLDLDDAPASRVKVYKVHHNAMRADLEGELSQARDYTAGGSDRFWTRVIGEEGPFRDLPPSTYLSLIAGQERPTTGTLHFPIRSYAENDRVVYDRVREFLDDADRLVYERAVKTFARRPLEDGVGMQSYVSLRYHKGERRLTVYLSPEAYHTVPARVSNTLAAP